MAGKGWSFSDSGPHCSQQPPSTGSVERDKANESMAKDEVFLAKSLSGAFLVSELRSGCRERTGQGPWGQGMHYKPLHWALSQTGIEQDR